MQKRNVLNSPRLSELKKNRRRSFINKIIFYLIGIFVILILLVFLSRLSSLNVNNIQVSGNQVIDTGDIKDVINQQISTKYIGLFPKTNIFFYPENSIKNALQDKFQRLENINLEVKNNKTLDVTVSERKALYTWCGFVLPGSTTTDNQNDQCYFMDQDGFIFDKAPYFSGGVYFKFYGIPDNFNSPQAGIDPTGFYFSKQNFQQLVSLRGYLIDFGLNPVSLYITSDGDVEVFLSSQSSSGAGPEIIFKNGSDFQNAAENLEAALTTEPMLSEFKNKYSSLLYIDLRYGNKVYYKFSTPAVK